MWESNLHDMVEPLQARTTLSVFGRLVAGCKDKAATAEATEKVTAALPWTRIEWMPLEDKSDQNGDWRRVHALEAFVGDDWAR